MASDTDSDMGSDIGSDIDPDIDSDPCAVGRSALPLQSGKPGIRHQWLRI